MTFESQKEPPGQGHERHELALNTQTFSRVNQRECVE